MDIAIAVRSLKIAPEMLALIAEVDEFKGTWQALNFMVPESLAALRKVATMESVGSSTRIEGARLSDQEVEALLSRIEMSSFQSRDEEEVAGYAEAMERLFLSYDSIPLTEGYIQQLHSMLLQHSGKDEHHRGRYKKLPNNVEAFGPDGKSLGMIFETATPFETPLQMQDLVQWTQMELAGGGMHPLLVISVFTVVFLAIHPFQDGNGRLSRILTTLLLLKTGYSYAPYSSLESVIEQNKESYYLALRRTQASLKEERPSWGPWVIFFLRAIQRQKVRLAATVEQSRRMLDMLSALEEKIVRLARTHGRIGISQIVRETKANRNTVKLRLSSLVRRELMVKRGGGRSTWYSVR